MSATRVYLQEGELEKLMGETMGRKNSIGGQAVVNVELGTGRLLPYADGTYDRWVLLVILELRGADLTDVYRGQLAAWRRGENIGVAR